jgi:ferredoxin
MPIVHFVKQNRSVACPSGTNLRRLARQNGIDLYVFPHNLTHCRGLGLCGTCRVKVDDPSALSAPTPAEERKLGWEGPQYRLACQSEVRGDVEVVTNPRRVYGWMNHRFYERMKDAEF